MLLAVLGALVPVVALSASPWSAATGAVVLGILPVLMAATAGPRAMASALGASALVAFVAVVIAGAGSWLVVLGTLLVAGAGIATGTLSVRGYHPVGAAALVLAAHLLVDPTSIVDQLVIARTPLGAAASVTSLVVVAGGWVIGCVTLLLRGFRVPAVTRPATLPYGVLLAVLCGALTFVCLTWFRGTNAWWSVLTVAMVLQPTRDETRTKLYGRVLGTLLGGTAVAALVVVLPAGWMHTILGVAATLGSVLLVLSGAAYWTVSVAATISVILLTFEPTDIVSGDLQRIVVTLLAGAVTATGVAVTAWLAPLGRPTAAGTP